MTGPLLYCPRMLTRVMTPIRSRSWAALREASLGVVRPPSGGDALARDRAVREVGMGLRLRRWVRSRASVLPLVTRVSTSSARSSVDSFWIALRGRQHRPRHRPHKGQREASVGGAARHASPVGRRVYSTAAKSSSPPCRRPGVPEPPTLTKAGSLASGTCPNSRPTANCTADLEVSRGLRPHTQAPGRVPATAFPGSWKSERNKAGGTPRGSDVRHARPRKHIPAPGSSARLRTSFQLQGVKYPVFCRVAMTGGGSYL